MTEEETKAIFKAHCVTAWDEWALKSPTNVATKDDVDWVMKRAMNLTRTAMEYGGGSYQQHADGSFSIGD